MGNDSSNGAGGGGDASGADASMDTMPPWAADLKKQLEETNKRFEGHKTFINTEIAKARRRSKSGDDDEASEGGTNTVGASDKAKTPATENAEPVTVAKMQQILAQFAADQKRLRDSEKEEERKASSARELEKLKSEFTDDQLSALAGRLEESESDAERVRVLRDAKNQAAASAANSNRGRDAPRASAGRGYASAERTGLSRPKTKSEFFRMKQSDRDKLLALDDFDPQELPLN